MSINQELLDELMHQYVANLENYWRCYHKGLPAPDPLPLSSRLRGSAVAPKPKLRLIRGGRASPSGSS
jgi:hypothetical protein